MTTMPGMVDEQRVLASIEQGARGLTTQIASMDDAKRRALMVRLATDFPLYTRNCLKVLPKVGGAPVPFVLNQAQAYLHERIQEQRRETGRARVIVLKGRQQGISTYTEGRYFHRTTYGRGRKTFIITHEDKATANLFSMVDRFYSSLPAQLRPTRSKSNAREMVFNRLDSMYSVATAGAKDTGRGGTGQLLHASEFAFWQNAGDHLTGIGQTIPEEPGTEVLIESTANGTANVFHQLWSAAVRGDSDYMPVFIPWFWQREYRRMPGFSFELSKDEREYRDTFGLDDAQMLWRRQKIATDFRGDENLFNREYPGSAELAFAASSPRALIKAMLVLAARRARDIEPVGLKIMGVDPAEYGDDMTSVWMRQGRVAQRIDTWGQCGPMETVGKLGLLIRKHQPDVINVDATNSAGITDRLIELGYPAHRVHFGASAVDDTLYALQRDEMWGEMLDWFEDRPVSIPDDDDIGAQLTSVEYTYDSARRKKLEAKERMKSRGLRSPDDADALALTFYRGSMVVNADDAEAFRKERGYA